MKNTEGTEKMKNAKRIEKGLKVAAIGTVIAYVGFKLYTDEEFQDKVTNAISWLSNTIREQTKAVVISGYEYEKKHVKVSKSKTA